jgi:gliding motility-associated-like protein
MKQFLTASIVLFFAGFAANSQQINITDPDFDQVNPIICANYPTNTTINFLDDGGSASNYSGNFNDTITICPDLPNGPKVNVIIGINSGFTWDVDATDTLYVYDGPNTSSPLLGAYNTSTNPTGFNHVASYINNPTGCLTFVFISDGATEGTGWEANISCANPPQPMDPHIEAFINGVGSDALDPVDTGYVDVCPGDSVLLVAKPDLLYSFENTGTGYSQNVDDLSYNWEFSDGTVGANNDSIWFFPPNSNGYLVQLTLTDDFPQTALMNCKVRVSVPPSFAGTGPIDDTVCFNQETFLIGGTNGQDTVGVDFPGGSFQFGGTVAGSTPLPDGSGINYSTDINMSGFPAGATFSSPSDLQDICVTMEHSFLGDLEMWLECPDGTTVTLFNANTGGLIPGGFGGGGTYLGEPLDGNQGTPGNGYEYCFSEVNNTWGDFPTEFGNNNTITLTSPPAPSAGNSMNPNGVYLPEETYNNFAGCPLNGTWTLNIRDNLGIDDGYIFEWGLFFDPTLFPNNESYQNTLVDSYWSPEPSITSGLNGDTTITVNPSTPGDYEYTFNVEDNFGCLYDTTVSLHVLDTVAVVNSLDTTVFCSTDSVPLWTTASGLEPFTYSWDDGQTGDTAYYDVSENGVYDYIVTISDACGIETIDTATITMNQTLIVDSLFQNPADCGIPNGYVQGFGDGFTGTPDYQWSGPGQPAADSIGASVWNNLASGWYYFTIEDDVCAVEDSIFLEQDPPPTASFDALPSSGNAPLFVEFVNTSDPATTYDWDFGNGETISVNDLSSQSTTYNEEGFYTVTLTISDGACSDQASQVITVIVILPLDYDMPNVFTPNNDDVNDVFSINAKNAESLEIVILNRWGNVVFESSDPDFEWNGKVQNTGAECVDGTYFYKFSITGEGDQQAEEHGFVQLVRD